MPSPSPAPPPPTTAAALRNAFLLAMPLLFVLLWSTGFLGAKLGVPYADPLTFLALRFGLVALLLGSLALALRAPWPTGIGETGHIAMVGFLVHAVYLGGVFVAIDWGVPAGLSALIVGLQPILTAVAVGPWLGETVSRRQWLGLALGLAGVVLVLSEKLTPESGLRFQGFGIGALLLCGMALLAITGGTLYQKRFCTGMDLTTGTTVQYVAATLATGLAAWLFEPMRIVWTGEFIFALVWLVFVLSIGAISLLMLLIKRGEAARTASLFYLVPPVTALFAWLLFDERLGPVALAGMAVVAVGVALVMRKR